MKGILHHHIEIVDAVALQDDDLSVGFIVVELGVKLLLGNILTDGLLVGFCITMLTIGNNEGYDDGFMFWGGETYKQHWIQNSNRMQKAVFTHILTYR
jgi:hypothetical protein